MGKINHRNRKFLLQLIVFAVILIALLGLSISILLGRVEYVEITDISEYGTIDGNGDNQTPEAFFDSFFPEKIDSGWIIDQYVYRACNIDAIGCEAYLELTIPDSHEFNAHVKELELRGGEFVPFSFNNSFYEYVLYDKFELTRGLSETTHYEYSIEFALIGKVLINPAENRMIYVMMCVEDGGGSNTEWLGTYFNRFGIDPSAYQRYLADQISSGATHHWEWSEWPFS